MTELWNLFLFHPLLNTLIWFYQLTGNFGWAVVSLTVVLRILLTPFVVPSLKLSKKMTSLKPELDELKVKHKDNKQALATAQAELYKQNGLNPAAGCLPQIVQILILIALYNAFNSVLTTSPAELVAKLNPMLYSFNQLASDFQLSTHFFSWDLIKPDVFHLPGLPFPLPGLLVVLSAAGQFFSSKLMMPAVKKAQKTAEKTSEDLDDIMAGSQQQMLYMFPLMSLFLGYQFPAGLVLYWFIFSVASVVQQLLLTKLLKI